MMFLKLQEMLRGAGCDFGCIIGWNRIRYSPISKEAWRQNLWFCEGKSYAHMCAHVLPY